DNRRLHVDRLITGSERWQRVGYDVKIRGVEHPDSATGDSYCSACAQPYRVLDDSWRIVGANFNMANGDGDGVGDREGINAGVHAANGDSVGRKSSVHREL